MYFYFILYLLLLCLSILVDIGFVMVVVMSFTAFAVMMLRGPDLGSCEFFSFLMKPKAHRAIFSGN